MSKVSIVGAYNTKFGAFVKKDREAGTCYRYQVVLRTAH